MSEDPDEAAAYQRFVEAAKLLPDLRPEVFRRELMGLGIPPICGLPYAGADPLGLGMALCVVDARLTHGEHRDKHGRRWKTDEGSTDQGLGAGDGPGPHRATRGSRRVRRG